MTDPTQFEKRTQEVLEESTARLDGRTRSRLTQARHTALGQLERSTGHTWWRVYVPAGAAAAVAVLAVVFWSGPRGTDSLPNAQNTSAVDDLELLADVEAPDFAAESEDLEFYEWAAGEVET
jgi:negative regulator of sigma E activity